ncbi:MAG: hypothetical protein WC707_06760 [Candidatus Babeliaceae bacterium]|jgi:hypothetical protein
MKIFKEILAWLLLFAFLIFVLNLYPWQTPNKCKNKSEAAKKMVTKTDTVTLVNTPVPVAIFPVNITVYHPTAAECGSDKGITATGDTINPKNPQRWVAVGSNYFSYLKNRSVTLHCNPCPLVNGTWTVKDNSGKISSLIEILIPNPDQVTFGGSWPGKMNVEL